MNTPRQTSLILSIKPKYVERIISGEKTVELRKRSAQIAPSAQVLIYSTSPCCAVVGEARISFREQLPLERLWKKFRAQAAVDREEFDEYYEGCTEGVAFGLTKIVRYQHPVTLDALRDASGGFRPPQSYMRVPDLIGALMLRIAQPLNYPSPA